MRAAALPWFAGDTYGDWHLVEDYAVPGDLAAGAVDVCHADAHDAAARAFAAGLYPLEAGDPAD